MSAFPIAKSSVRF